MTPRDPNTLANYGEWLTKHTTVNFKVDFEKQRLEGSVRLELESLTDKKSQEVILGSYFLESSVAPPGAVLDRSQSRK